MPLDGITISSIVQELSEKLVGGKIDKINQAEKDELLFSIRNNQTGYKLLISANSANPRIYLCESYKKENPLQAPMFLMLLRKHLGGGRILSVAQQGFDRHILIDIEAYDELRVLKTKTLSIEIMGKHSNIILINKESDRIIDSIKRVSLSMSSIREILPQRPFTLPPTQGKNDPLSILSLEQFASLLRTKNQPVFKAIYTNFEGIAPISAKQICYMANLNDSHSTYELSELQLERLKNSFDRFFSSISSHQTTPCVVYEKNGGIVDFSATALTIYDSDSRAVLSRDSISLAAEEFFHGKDLKERIAQKTYGLRKSLQIKMERLKTKLEKQVNEINEAKGLEELAHLGELLTANIYRMQKGMREIEVIDYHDSEMPMIRIPLSENLTPSENIQVYFRKYNKSKSRINELTSQLKQTKDELDYLQNVMVSINNIDSLDAIEEIREEMVREGYYSVSTTNKNKKKSTSLPMEFISADGFTILVGKNNTQNDTLTLKTSRPTDVWLHTKEIAGSHVIIKATLDEVSKEALYEAAMLVAYYSQARASAQVPVDYAPRKNVKKPSGAKPGMVVYDDYGTVYVTPDEAKLPRQITQK